MKPLMFGPASRQLFGIFHPVEEGQAVQNTAVLICPPFGKEALRAHRFFRVFAQRLARVGIATLRFDLHGCGDSPGDEIQGELDGWRRDIGAAHDELRRLRPDANIVWVGARLGGTLAVLAARNGRCDPVRLVLWEPVVDGLRYGRLLRDKHVAAIDASFCIPNLSLRRSVQLGNELPAEALGTSLSPALRAQLRALTADALPLTALYQTLVLSLPTDDPCAQWAAAQQLRHMPVKLTYFQHAMDWTSDPYPNQALVPAEALSRLQSALHE